MYFNFPIDEDTLFNMNRFVIPYMAKYYHLSTEASVEMINDFFEKTSKLVKGLEGEITAMLDRVLNRYHPFELASEIIFKNSPELIEKYTDHYDWLKSMYGTIMPQSVHEDYRRWKPWKS